MSAKLPQANSNKLPYIVHGIAILLTLVFIMAGGTKLLTQPMHVENFARWGYPSWFMYLTGFMEVSGAILIPIPQSRFYGAALLICVMLGAVTTHVINSEFGMIPLPFVLFGLASFVAWQSNPFKN